MSARSGVKRRFHRDEFQQAAIDAAVEDYVRGVMEVEELERRIWLILTSEPLFPMPAMEVIAR